MRLYKTLKRKSKKILSIQKNIKKLYRLNTLEKKILGYFTVLQSLGYVVLFAYWEYIQEIESVAYLVVLLLVIINCLQLAIIMHYFVLRREVKLHETFGSYHLYLDPILAIIQKKEIKLHQMTVDFKNSMPMSQEEMELRAQKIVNTCFIQLNFTGDSLLNALFFKYYNLYQSRKVELKTLVSKEFELDDFHRVMLYEAVEFSFELMLWLLSYESSQLGRQIKSDDTKVYTTTVEERFQTKRITFVMLQGREGVQFNCCYESEFSDFMEIVTYFEREKKKKYRLELKRPKICFELSPKRIMIMMKHYV